MTAILVTCFICTSLLSLGVGVRLLWVWRRTRMFPELAIGSGYVLGIVGLAFLVAADDMGRAGKDAFAPYLIGHLTMELSQAALILAAWRIFGRRPLWIPALGVGMCAASMLNAVIRGEVEQYSELNFNNLSNIFTGVYAYGWIAVESLLYSKQLARRRILGLSDTLDVWRFRLWGVSGTATAITALLSLFSIGVYGLGLSRVPPIFAVTQLLVVVSSVGTVFAFFPPAFYRRRAAKHDIHSSVLDVVPVGT